MAEVIETSAAYAEKVLDVSRNFTGNRAKIIQMLRKIKEDKRVAGISTKGGVEYFGLGVNTLGEFCSFTVLGVGRIIIIDIDEIASITIEL